MTASRSQLTTAAREVLKRAEFMQGELRANPTGVAWEAKFSASLALLRSVGHALKKVDAMRSPEMKAAVDLHWKEMKAGKSNSSPEIFWAFIEEERNLVIKEGEVRAGQSAMISVVGVQIAALAPGQIAPPAPPAKSQTVEYTYHMNDGVFRGRDPRDLVEESIK